MRNNNMNNTSFIIKKWFNLSGTKRLFIQCYDENVWEIWKKKKLKYEKFKYDYGYMVDSPFYGEEYSLKEPNKKYDFGFINNICRWKFEENFEKNICRVSCSMDNFNMEEWLKYNKVDFEKEE